MRRRARAKAAEIAKALEEAKNARGFVGEVDDGAEVEDFVEAEAGDEIEE